MRFCDFSEIREFGAINSCLYFCFVFFCVFYLHNFELFYVETIGHGLHQTVFQRDKPVADPELSQGELIFGRFYLHKNNKIVRTKKQKFK